MSAFGTKQTFKRASTSSVFHPNYPLHKCKSYYIEGKELSENMYFILWGVFVMLTGIGFFGFECWFCYVLPKGMTKQYPLETLYINAFRVDNPIIYPEDTPILERFRKAFHIYLAIILPLGMFTALFLIVSIYI